MAFKFLDLVASEYFSNQHSASFDRLVATQGIKIFSDLRSTHPSFLISEFNLFYATERRLAMADDVNGYLNWFASRIDLFERICLPSFDALVVKPSHWFLLCDQPQSNQEESLLNQLSSLSRLFTVIVADFRPANTDFERHYTLKPELIRRCIAHILLDSAHSAIITARLDTDDSLESYIFIIYTNIFICRCIFLRGFLGTIL